MIRRRARLPQPKGPQVSLYNLRYIINAKAQIEADSEDAARAVLADIIDDCIDLLPGDYVDIVSCERER